MPSLSIVGLPSPVERDNRHVHEVSNATFYGLLLFLPVWICTVLPLSLPWQVFRVLKQLVLGKPTWHLPPLDYGIQVKPDDIILPLSKRKYDIVVLGVTGFTGRLAARHLAQKYGVNNNNKTDGGVIWAMAGRSQAKLDRVKKELADELNLPELVQNVDTIVVDTLNATTVHGLVKDTRVVATTAGPYQLYGNSVVELCAKYGTHYVDITGEVGWAKTMMCQWNDVAKQTGAKIIPFCGMDSIPWDLTVQVLRELLQKEYQDDLQTVKVWNELVAGPPGGTIATACLHLDGMAPRSKIDPFSATPQGTKSTHTIKESMPLFIDPFFDDRWTAPYVMAQINSRIVKWSHALQQKGAPVLSYREVQLHPNFKTAFVHAIGLLILGSCLLNPLTRYLVRRFLLPSEGQGPSLDVMETKNYLCVTAEGLGTKGNRAETVLYFRQDPGCLETARMLVETGLCLALDKGNYDSIPSKKLGGFWTPSAALGDALLGRLLAAGAELSARVVPKADEPAADTGKLKES